MLIKGKIRKKVSKNTKINIQIQMIHKITF